VSLNPKVTIPKNTVPKTKRTEHNTTNPSETTITTDPSETITRKESITTIRVAKKKAERGGRTEISVICVD
jgi:hypothetical protein